MHERAGRGAASLASEGSRGGRAPGGPPEPRRMPHEDQPSLQRPRYGSIVDDERLSAEEMDERRRQNIAYEYLCHLEEAKRWMEVCLVEELPPTTELEEGLRNGVYLAKLAKFFAPKMVSEKKIYDVEQTRYKVTEI